MFVSRMNRSTIAVCNSSEELTIRLDSERLWFMWGKMKAEEQKPFTVFYTNSHLPVYFET